MDSRLYSGNDYAEGSIQYLTDFVQEMKGYGLKVILDVVVNHGGYGIREQNPSFNRLDFSDCRTLLCLLVHGARYP